MWQLICLIAGHRRIRRDVRSRGDRYRTNCARCGRPIAKDPRTGNWVNDREAAHQQN
ncbi:hypothetical protein OK349_16370 [Sphingomonas sp. BT-65]|uniref:hypothetical protein n=1 Tax=Sphingomonas sp. BT-65 TaxID=2989821 RepID=UPI0022365221|nr:hypothetical protein [Sphingomonas sp. BT-65]MCW4463290.1 hypothetical protein [Sphingomonas sp. BT-65]